jgi:hypothetical protein
MKKSNVQWLATFCFALSFYLCIERLQLSHERAFLAKIKEGQPGLLDPLPSWCANHTITAINATLDLAAANSFATKTGMNG